METCVLIPADLSLVLQPHSDAPNVMEMCVRVWANRTLHPGTTFHPDRGSVRLDTLEVYSILKSSDVRLRFGAFDEIHEVDGVEVRHCNWVRFVQSSTNLDHVNVVGVHVKGRILYQVVKVIPANTELKVFFDVQEENEEVARKDTVVEKTLLNETTDKVNRPLSGRTHGQEGPPVSSDEVSNVSSEAASNISSEAVSNVSSEAVSNVSPETLSNGPNESFPTSPLSPTATSVTSPLTDREEDCPSAFSDITASSEDSSCSIRSGGTGNNSSASISSFNQSTPISVVSPDTKPSMLAVSTPPLPGSGIVHIASGLVSSMASMRMPARRNKERTWLPCEVCGKKFDRPSLLRRHMRTHTGEKPHACDVCGKAFSTSSSLNTHRRIHSGEKPHQCQVCGKRFTASSNLYYHKMTHNKEKPHKCTLCSKSFPTPGDLKSHMYVHNGSWPYKCDICNRGFSKQTNLRNHLLLHTGDKPHECQLCGKRFALQCNLRTHLKTHEGEPQEECFRCGKMYLSSRGQVIGGYCRQCLEKSASVAHRDKNRPVSHSGAFTVEALTTPTPKPPTVTDLVIKPRPISMTSQFGHLHAFGMAPHMTGLAMRHGRDYLQYSSAFGWPKAVPQNY